MYEHQKYHVTWHSNIKGIQQVDLDTLPPFQKQNLIELGIQQRNGGWATLQDLPLFESTREQDEQKCSQEGCLLVITTCTCDNPEKLMKCIPCV